MKYFISFIIFQILTYNNVYCQNDILNTQMSTKIISLIEQYSEARDAKDTVLLKEILTDDIDQLVSSGEWRIGIGEAISGMMGSSTANPGERKLVVEKIRFVDDLTGIVDARYEIESPNGASRKMWSTFIVVYRDECWKISGIRNMLPTGQQ